MSDRTNESVFIGKARRTHFFEWLTHVAVSCVSRARTSHLPTAPALSHSCTKLSNRGSLATKYCAPWSKVACVPS
eukprot:769321-Prorocentrum_minimum.AAC.1